MDFKQWIETFVEEKELDKEEEFIVDHKANIHFIVLATVVQLCKQANEVEQDKIKKDLVFLDFHNADVMDYFEHLAKAYVYNNF